MKEKRKNICSNNNTSAIFLYGERLPIRKKPFSYLIIFVCRQENMIEFSLIKEERKSTSLNFWYLKRVFLSNGILFSVTSCGLTTIEFCMASENITVDSGDEAWVSGFVS